MKVTAFKYQVDDGTVARVDAEPSLAFPDAVYVGIADLDNDVAGVHISTADSRRIRRALKRAERKAVK